MTEAAGFGYDRGNGRSAADLWPKAHWCKHPAPHSCVQ